MIHLETERLILRPIHLTDSHDFFEYAQHPEVGPNAGWKPHETLEETVKIIKEIFLEQDTIWGIVRKTDAKLIGSVGLLPDPKRSNDQAMMLGYALGYPYWYQGYMTEAVREVIRYGLEDLQLQLISASCYPHNQRSRAVLKKCGFVYEGTLQQAEKLYNGQIYDHECYALTVGQYIERIF